MYGNISLEDLLFLKLAEKFTKIINCRNIDGISCNAYLLYIRDISLYKMCTLIWKYTPLIFEWYKQVKRRKNNYYFFNFLLGFKGVLFWRTRVRIPRLASTLERSFLGSPECLMLYQRIIFFINKKL